MKIKLISPLMGLRPMDSEYKRVLSPSLALLVLAGLTPAEHEVVLADENAGPLRLDDQPDLVGIAVNVNTSPRAYELADHYRRRGIPVVLGGIHPGAMPEEAMEHADAICIGEAENVWADILRDAARGQLQQHYRSARPADLARTPFPRWDLLDTSKYLYTCIVCASRGCPFSCEFCYNSCAYVQHGYRTRPVSQVMAEIGRLGTRQVMFIDDNLIGDPEWTGQLLQAMQPLRLIWHAAVSANLVHHPGLMDLMQASGCRSLFIGFESINQDSLRLARKTQNKILQYEQLIAALHTRGIMVNASLAFGFDHDRPDVFDRTLAWLIANKVETMTGHILTPYPGTRLYRRLEQEGRITDRDLSHYDTAHVVFRPRHMSREELLQGYLGIYRRFYSWSGIWRRLPARAPNRLPFLLFNLGYRKFGKFTSRLARLGLMHRIGMLARRLAYGID